MTTSENPGNVKSGDFLAESWVHSEKMCKTHNFRGTAAFHWGGSHKGTTLRTLFSLKSP